MRVLVRGGWTMRVLVRGGVNNESHGERVVRGWTMRVKVRGW